MNSGITEAPSVLLLPGLLCDHAVWTDVVPALAGHRAIVVSYGALDSLEAMARHALSLAPPGPVIVIGHSMGGRVALEVLRMAPERVQRLALLDTGFDALPAGPNGELERTQRMALVDQARREGMRAMGQAWARGMVHPDRLESPVFGAILDMIERKTPEVFEAQQRALLARPSARALLPTIACPTLVLCGRQDTWSPLSRHVEMQQLIPQSELAVIDDCGHMCTMERPAAVADALRSSLNREALAS